MESRLLCLCSYCNTLWMHKQGKSAATTPPLGCPHFQRGASWDTAGGAGVHPWATPALWESGEAGVRSLRRRRAQGIGCLFSGAAVSQRSLPRWAGSCCSGCWRCVRCSCSWCSWCASCARTATWHCCGPSGKGDGQVRSRGGPKSDTAQGRPRRALISAVVLGPCLCGASGRPCPAAAARGGRGRG
jgi:hypothetical protein